jgi:DNA-directed RNA polymerase specialized sigma24 family protein
VQDPETLRLLVDTWSTMLPRLFKEALKMTKGVADAEDLVQDAYLAIAQGTRRWYPKKCPDFYWFVHGIMRSLSSHVARDGALHGKVPLEAGEPGSAQIASSTPDPEQLGVMKQSAAHHAVLLHGLRMLLATDPLALKILDLPDDAEEEDTPATAARLGVDRDDVERAWDRVRYAAAKMSRGRPMLRAPGPSEDALAHAELTARGVDIEAVRARMRAKLEREEAFERVAAARRRSLIVIGTAAGLVALAMAAAFTQCFR